MDRKEMKKQLKQANELKDKIVDLLNESDIETGLALTVLSSLSVDCALNMAKIPPHEYIRMVAQAVCLAVDVNEEDEEEEEEHEQTFSRTTH